MKAELHLSKRLFSLKNNLFNKKKDKRTRKYTLSAIKEDWKKYKYLYLFFALPVVIYFVIFKYIPLYGLQIAFRDYKVTKGIWGSPFVGLENFSNFLNSVYFVRLMKNTIIISFQEFIFGFPAPILFALALNEVRNKTFKKAVQTITYLPHFVSIVVLCGLIATFSSQDGLFNTIIAMFGGEKQNLLMNPHLFRPIFVWSGVWGGFGWGSILYLSALASVDEQQYEAAYIDGANRWQRLIHITIPGIMPTIVIQLILRIGSLFGVGAEKLLLLYSPAVYETADVISTYVYRKGLLDFDFGYATAVGIFNSIINITLLMIANKISRKVNETSLW